MTQTIKIFTLFWLQKGITKCDLSWTLIFDKYLFAILQNNYKLNGSGPKIDLLWSGHDWSVRAKIPGRIPAVEANNVQG